MDIMTKQRITAIPTTHNGIKMRSRLEGKVASLFDSHGLKWMYEAEGLDINGIWYLPDFWIPELKCFVEVKGVGPGSTPREALANAIALRQQVLTNAVNRSSFFSSLPED